MRAIIYGVLASFFFAFTFLFNRLMSNGGGSWIWSASLRYVFMVPFLLLIVAGRRKLRPLIHEMRRHPWRWGWWSFVGFGLFYAPLCFAAAYSPAWLVAGAWQFTIIAGSLVVPLFQETIQTPDGPVRRRMRIPLKGMGMSCIILFGMGLMEWSEASYVSGAILLLGAVPIVIASFAYPLGNRKMMELCQGRLDAVQRTLGMTIASLPLWIVLGGYALARHGLPSASQTSQSLVVAIFSGVIATVLFFTATDLAGGNVHRLATVEATQSAEVVFVILGEFLLIPSTKVSEAGFIGVGLVVIGMILHSRASIRRPADRNVVVDEESSVTHQCPQ